MGKCKRERSMNEGDCYIADCKEIDEPNWGSEKDGKTYLRVSLCLLTLSINLTFITLI